MFKDDVVARFYSVFTSTATEAVEGISKTSISLMKPNTGRPLLGVLSIRDGRIRDALLAPANIVSTPDQIEVFKLIPGKVPYIHEKGFSYMPTREQWKKMFGALKRLGWYDKNFKGRKDGHIIFPPRSFAKPAVDSMTSTDIKNIVIQKIKNEFNNTKVIVVE